MGRVKPQGSIKTRNESKKPKISKASSNDDLRSHIRALGGDEVEDYELIKDVDSDGLEDNGNNGNNTGLLKDISKFMKSLDFKSVQTTLDEEPASTHSTEGEAETKREVTKGEKHGTVKMQNEVSGDVTSHAKPDTRIAEVTTKFIEKNKSSKVRFVVSPSPQWYLNVPSISPAGSKPTPSPEFLTLKKNQGAKLLEQEAEAYAGSSAHTSSAADARFLSRVLASGTLSDRLSALTLMVQGSPVHNTRALDSLKSMASKKGREESLKALRAIVDWWTGGGAPDRKLKYFVDQPITHPNVTNQHLVFWYFEDWLKKYFFVILQLLEGLSVDPLPYVRTQAMHLIYQLLRDKPEQEQNLLRLLLNKLNDAEKSIASKASHHLLQLLQLHPQMNKIIVQEVSGFILRPAANKTSSSSTMPASQPTKDKPHARYYAVITFNQIVLTPKDKEVAEQLIDVYFELFKELLGEGGSEEESRPEDRDFTPKQRRGIKGNKKEVRKDRKGKGKATDNAFQEVSDDSSKLVSAILTGINRALPFAKSENSVALDKQIDTLFRITHSATFNVSLQALVLIHFICRSRPSVSPRFYRTLYASLVDPRLTRSAKQAMYLNLLFKAVKEDRNHARVAAFVKRFLQVLSLHPPEFICGGLYLLGELFNVSGDVRSMTDRVLEEREPYDPRKRDPQYAHAEFTCLWELLPFLNHYHPSVALHARQLLASTQVTATADLGLNTLSHFLDRFVYRNPKKLKPKGASAMQPDAHDDEPGMVHAGKTGHATDVVLPERFRKQKEGDVPVDQIFFHKFFSKEQDKERARASKADKRKSKNDESKDVEEDHDDSDPDEAEIWKAMRKSIPELGGDDVDEDIDEDDASLGDLPSDSADDDIGSQGAASTGSEDGSEAAYDEARDVREDSDSSAHDFIEDDDDLISMNGENLTDLIEYPSGSESEGEVEWQGFGSESKVRKREQEKDSSGRKKKKQKLATFASYEDYAEMIENSKEDNL